MNVGTLNWKTFSNASTVTNDFVYAKLGANSNGSNAGEQNLLDSRYRLVCWSDCFALQKRNVGCRCIVCCWIPGTEQSVKRKVVRY